MTSNVVVKYEMLDEIVDGGGNGPRFSLLLRSRDPEDRSDRLGMLKMYNFVDI